MTERTILTVGSLNMDQVVHVPRLPVLGETLLGAGSLRLVPGGKGANQAVAMARLGGRVRMAGRIGSDPFGAQLRQALAADSVDTSLLVTDKQEASGVAFIFLTLDGDNAIVVASGANGHVGEDPAQMSSIQEALATAQALVLQLEIPLPTVEQLIQAGHAARVPVILNLAPAQPLPGEILRQVEVLIVNETEASFIRAALATPEHSASTGDMQITDIADARHLAEELCAQGVSQVAITLGVQGAVLAFKNAQGQAESFHQSAPRVQVVDTTAAGDCFVGAFTVALTEGKSPQETLRFAVHASALKVTKFGAQSGLPTRAEVDALLRSA